MKAIHRFNGEIFMSTIPKPDFPDYGEELQKIVCWAVIVHSKQFRKREIGGLLLPYIVHPLEVAKQIWEWETCTLVMLKAAILHDVIEDTDCTFDHIKSYGLEVANLVQELTCEIPDDVPKEEALKLKQKYVESFKDKTVEALVTKLADRICNTKDFMLTDPKYAGKYFFKKAKSLLDVWNSRKQEVEKKFGEKPARNIQYSIDSLVGELAGK